MHIMLAAVCLPYFIHVNMFNSDHKFYIKTLQWV